MVEEIAVEHGQIYNLEGLVTLILDRVILHTVVHRSSTSTYMPNFIEMKETFCGRTDGRTYVRSRPYVRTYVRTDGRTYAVRTFETSFIRSTLLKSRPNERMWHGADLDLTGEFEERCHVGRLGQLEKAGDPLHSRLVQLRGDAGQVGTAILPELDLFQWTGVFRRLDGVLSAQHLLDLTRPVNHRR